MASSFRSPAGEEGVVEVFREAKAEVEAEERGGGGGGTPRRRPQDAIERLRVGGRAERRTGRRRVMPPLGRTLMGLWASEAYSFHPVSTSRFPSILFHNTPGDVYVLQDARKMRSRLHSDTGRFTAGDAGGGGGSRTKRDERRKRRNPCARDRAGICEGVPITFRIGDPPYSTDRTTPITRARSRVRVLTLREPVAKFDPKAPWAACSFRRELDASYLPATERKTNYSKIARR